MRVISQGHGRLRRAGDIGRGVCLPHVVRVSLGEGYARLRFIQQALRRAYPSPDDAERFARVNSHLVPWRCEPALRVRRDGCVRRSACFMKRRRTHPFRRAWHDVVRIDVRGFATRFRRAAERRTIVASNRPSKRRSVPGGYCQDATKPRSIGERTPPLPHPGWRLRRGCRASVPGIARSGRRHRHAADRQRRTPARDLSAEARDDPVDRAAAAARDAIRGLRPERHHAERRVLRPLSPGRRATRHRRCCVSRRGHRQVRTPLSLSVADLRAMPAVELVAVNQCSGNSRGFFDPRVASGQLANGALGNAKWRGVPLKALLDKAGIDASAKQVTFDGADGPVLPTTPDFVKALDLDHAMDGEVMVAYAMNDADLPMLNGHPVRLVVPGYFGTYWVKHLATINVVDSVYDGFWMKSAYRIPDNPCACVEPEPGTAPKKTVPINRFTIRSFVTSVADGARVPAGREFEVRGFAFDGGFGIREVALSIGGGKSWVDTTLDADLGKYSFRGFRTRVWLREGEHVLMSRAVNAIGQTQPRSASWNPAGYLRNIVESTRVTAVAS